MFRESAGKLPILLRKDYKSPDELDAEEKLDGFMDAQTDQFEMECGGRGMLIDALIQSGKEEAKPFVQALSKGVNSQKSIWGVCKDLKKSPDELVRIFTEGKLMKSKMDAYLKLAEGLPSVMDKSVKVAQLDEGFKDREMLFKMSGLIEENKGVSVNVNQQVRVDGRGFEDVVKGCTDISREDPFKDAIEGEIVEEGNED